MARIDKKSQTSVSLFPFLSILACVMGTLMLIICGVALGETPDGPSPETYQQVIDKITKITAETERLKAMISGALDREKQASNLRDEIARLASLLPGTLEQMKLAATLLPQYEELMRQIKTLEEQLTQSTLQLNDLKNQIKTMEEELDGLELVRPTGLTTGLIPPPIECTADALTAHPRPKTAFDHPISWTKGQPECCIVLLSSYRRARFEESQVLARKSDVQYGCWPLPSEGGNRSELPRNSRAASESTKGVAPC